MVRCCREARLMEAPENWSEMDIRSMNCPPDSSLDSHGGETANDSTILAIISLPVDVDFLLVFKVFVSLSQLVLFSLHVREPWN